MQNIEGKPEINYPTEWEYRVIGMDKQKIKEVIAEVILQDYALKEGQQSSGGKFVSVIVSTIVQSEEQRDSFFAKLKQNPNVNMVL